VLRFHLIAWRSKHAQPKNALQRGVPKAKLSQHICGCKMLTQGSYSAVRRLPMQVSAKKQSEDKHPPHAPNFVPCTAADPRHGLCLYCLWGRCVAVKVLKAIATPTEGRELPKARVASGKAGVPKPWHTKHRQPHQKCWLL